MMKLFKEKLLQEWKQFRIIFVIVLTMALFAQAVNGGGYNINGSSVYIDDEFAYINVDPAVTTDCSIITMQSKGYNGNVTLAVGVDTSIMYPNSVYYENWRNETTEKYYTCDAQNTTFGYNATAKKAWCILTESANGTNISTVLFNGSYDRGNVSAKTVWWNVTSQERWNKLSVQTTPIEADYDGKNKWWHINQYHVNDTAHTIKVCFMIPNTVKIGETLPKYKYDFALWPNKVGSTEYPSTTAGFVAAKNDNKLWFIDPWTIGFSYAGQDEGLSSSHIVAFYDMEYNVTKGVMDYYGTNNLTSSANVTPSTTAKNGTGSLACPNRGGGASSLATKGSLQLNGLNATNSNWTVCAWLYRQGTSTTYYRNAIGFGTSASSGNGLGFTVGLHNGAETTLSWTQGGTIAGDAVIQNQWILECVTYFTNKNVSMWHNTTYKGNTNSLMTSYNFTSGMNLSMCHGLSAAQGGDTNNYYGLIDNVMVISKALNITEITQIYNGWLPTNLSPTLTFTSMTPPNLTSTNIVQVGVSIQYNATGSSKNLTNNSMFLYYKTNTSTIGDYSQYINGSVISVGWQNKTPTGNYLNNTAAYPSINYTLDDNEVYPATYNIDPEVMETTTHVNTTLAQKSDLLKVQFLNVSTYSNGIFEIMTTNTSPTSTPLNVYYCNNTYSTGDPSTTLGCTLFSTISSKLYNHTHTGGYSSHNAVPFIINQTTNSINGVAVTSTSYFIIQNSNTGANNRWQYSSIAQQARSGSTQTSNNTGTSYSNSDEVDAHLHQFNTSGAYSTLWYYSAVGDVTLNITNSSVQAYNFTITTLAPNSPILDYPVDGVWKQTGESIYSNWSESIPGYNASIVNYTLQVFNSSNELVYTLAVLNSSTLSYNWTVNNLTKGSWYVGVKSTQNDSQSSSYSKHLVNVNNIPVAELANVSGPIYRNSTVNYTMRSYDADGDLLYYLILITYGPGVFDFYLNYTANVTQNTTVLIYQLYDRTILTKGRNLSAFSTATDDDFNQSYMDYANLTVQNTPPIAGTPTLSPTTVYKTTDHITCTNTTYYDDDEDSLSQWNYTWYVDGSVVKYGTDNNLTNASYSKTNNVTCAVQAFDGTDYSIQSNASLLISDSYPVITSVTFTPTIGYSNSTFIVLTNGTDDDGDNIYYYLWRYINADATEFGPYNKTSGTEYNLLNDTANAAHFTILTYKAYACRDTSCGLPYNSSYSIAINISNLLPIISTARLYNPTNVSDTATQLFCNASDADSDQLTYNYTLFRNGVQYFNNVSGLFGQGSEKNVINITVPSGNYTLQCWASDGYNSTSSVNSSVLQILGYFNESIQYQTAVMELTNTMFYLNVTNDDSDANATLVYNGVEYTPTKTQVALTSVFNTSILTPLLTIPFDGVTNLSQLQNFTWKYNYSRGGTLQLATYNNTQNVTQAYYPMAFTISSTDTVETQPYYLYPYYWNYTDKAVVQVLIQKDNTNYTLTSFTNASNISQWANASFTQGLNTNTSENHTHSATLNITYGGSQSLRNYTAVRNMTTYKMLFSLCNNTYISNSSIIISFYDGLNPLLGINTNTGTGINLNAYYPGSTAVKRNAIIAFNGTPTQYICYQPPLTYAINVSLDFTITAVATDYASTSVSETAREFYVATTGYDPITYTVYMSSAYNYSTMRFHVLDQSANPYAGWLVQQYQYSALNGSYSLIASDNTDFTGTIPFSVLTTSKYAFNITDGRNTSVKYTTGLIQPTLTDYYYYVPDTTDWINQQTENMQGINHTLTNSSSLVLFTWASSSSDVTQVCMDVFNGTGYNFMQNITSACSASNSGAMNYTVGAGDRVVVQTRVIGANFDSNLDVLNVYNYAYTSFGLNGLFWAFILTGTMMIAGFVAAGLAGGVVLSAVGLGVSSLLHLTSFGWTTIIGLVCIGVFLIVAKGRGAQ